MNSNEIETLTVGSKFYRVQQTNTPFDRKKIHITIDGVDYFRYDRPLIEYTILECRILGIVEKVGSGMWPDDEDYELGTMYYVQTWDPEKDETKHFTTDDSWFQTASYTNERGCFLDRDDAMCYKKELEEKARELDRGV